MSSSRHPNKKRLTKILSILFGVVVFAVIGGLVFLFSYTYTVSGKVTDISNGQAVKDVKIVIAGHSQTTDDQGRYVIDGIKIYEKNPIIVTLPGQFVKHDDIQLDYKELKYTNDFTVEPTLVEIVNRISTASMNGQYDYLWDLMHSDDKSQWGTKDEYKDLLSKRDNIYSSNKYSTKSINIGQNIRYLNTWKSSITNKEYELVAEVPLKFIMIDNGKEQPDNTLTYYKKVDGFYHYFTNVNKDELKKWVNEFNS